MLKTYGIICLEVGLEFRKGWLRIGVFRWRYIAVLLIVYMLLAIVMISLALPSPSYEGLVAPSGFRTLLYNVNPLIAVFTSSNTTLIYRQDSIYKLSLKAISSCYANNQIVLALDDGSIYIVNPARGAAEIYRLSFTLKPLSISCSIDSLIVAGMRGNDIILVDFRKAVGYIMGGFEDGGKITVYTLKDVFYIVNGSNTVKFVDSQGGGIIVLPEVVSVKGLTSSSDGLIAYGSWGSSGLIYRFNVGEALLINVPGRTTSIDSLACTDYRCTAIIIPQGDWPIVVEYNRWAYISDAKIVGVKPFIYNGSGASDTPWFSGEFIGVGTAVISVYSTRNAIIGFNSTHALVWVENGISPSPSISKIKIFYEQKRVEYPEFPIIFEVSEYSLEHAVNPILTVKPQYDRLNIMITLLVITSPALVYLYRYYLGSRNPFIPRGYL